MVDWALILVWNSWFLISANRLNLLCICPPWLTRPYTDINSLNCDLFHLKWQGNIQFLLFLSCDCHCDKAWIASKSRTVRERVLPDQKFLFFLFKRAIFFTIIVQWAIGRSSWSSLFLSLSLPSLSLHPHRRKLLLNRESIHWPKHLWPILPLIYWKLSTSNLEDVIFHHNLQSRPKNWMGSTVPNGNSPVGVGNAQGSSLLDISERRHQFFLACVEKVNIWI